MNDPSYFQELIDVWNFQSKFDVPMLVKPELLDPQTMNFRINFMLEELDEMEEAFRAGNLHKVVDALVDLEYVLKGTVLMMGLFNVWPECWDRVHRANLQKERATSAAQSKRGSALDVIKPPGWKPPHFKGILPEASPGDRELDSYGPSA